MSTFQGMFGSILGGSPKAGGSVDYLQLEMQSQRLAAEFLQTHKSAYSFTFNYRGSSYWSGFFASSEEREDAFVELLSSLKYKPRRFWEFWRSGETRPSKAVLKRLAAMKQGT